jgi:hypothetical protein
VLSFVRFEFLMVELLNAQVFWDVMS